MISNYCDGFATSSGKKGRPSAITTTVISLCTRTSLCRYRLREPRTNRQKFRLHSNTQVGISILDTRDLNPPPQENVLTLATYNFVTGSDSYYAASAKRYLWGTPEKILPSDMLNAMNKHVSRPDRNIILVGHGCERDLAALSSLGFNLKASVVDILDTANIASELQMKGLSLGRLLDKLKCPKARLHNAGNDAHFTLRALILLAIKGHEEQDPVDEPQVEERRKVVERLEALRALALTSLPIASPRPQEKTRPKEKRIRKIHIAVPRTKEKRICMMLIVRPKTKKNRTRKGDIAKTWSLEKQEEIREERRQKRMTNIVADGFDLLTHLPTLQHLL